MGGRGRCISEFEANLVDKVSSRTAKATQRNPISKKKKKTNKRIKKKERKKKNRQTDNTGQKRPTQLTKEGNNKLN